MKPFLDSTDVIDDAAELRTRAERDGYLYLQGLLPTDTLKSLRLQIVGIVNDAGWVAPDTPIEDAVANLDNFCVEPDPDYMDVYARIYALPDFHAIQGTPDTYTAWMPLTDLPAEMGGLQIASGSHLKGVYEFEPSLGAGGMA